MTMTVLTDAELTACVPLPPRWAILESESMVPCRVVANVMEYGRAVEAAVLRKGAYQTALTAQKEGYVPEATARERERAAHMRGFYGQFNDERYEREMCEKTGMYQTAVLFTDRRYPLPTPEPPKFSGNDYALREPTPAVIDVTSGAIDALKRAGLCITIDTQKP